MKLSQYTLILPCDESPDELLLYSTQKASLIRIHKDVYESVRQGSLSEADQNLLAELSLLTEDRKTEQQGMVRFLNELSERSEYIDITAVLNLDCNFACTYCFEEPIKRPYYMTFQTADLMISFIESRMTDAKKNVKIRFYGGEPLLSMDLIRYISKSAKKLAKQKGGAFESSMVTNGSLFTRKIAQELVGLSLKKVQITLDGPPEVHDRYRPFKSGKGSFRTIMNNIKETWDLVDIHIGGNFDRSSVGFFVKLLQ